MITVGYPQNVYGAAEVKELCESLGVRFMITNPDNGNLWRIDGIPETAN